MNLISQYISESIKEDSVAAINRGNKFKGYLGQDVKDLSRENLEGLLNILNDEIQVLKEYKNRYNEIALMSIG